MKTRKTKWCLPPQRNCFIHNHPNNTKWNCSDYSTVDYLWLLLWECGSLALQWCYLRCSALADRWPLGPPPFGWFLVFPWLQVATCLLWLGRSWGSTCESLKARSCQGLCWLSSGFSWRGAKFFAASIFHFHFPHIILLPSSCISTLWPCPCASLGSPPPCSRPLRRGHFELVYLPLSPPSLVFPGVLVAASLGGQRLRSVLLSMEIFSLSTRSWFHLFVPSAEQNYNSNYSVIVNL